MVETPTATAFTIDAAESDETDVPLLPADQKSSKKSAAIEPELFLVKQKPITAKIRTTINHLRKEAGFLSRFRGLQVAILIDFLHQLVVKIFVGASPPSMWAEPIVAIITTVALCRLEMAWTHIVISAPSDKRWFRRIPSVKSGKNVIIPTAIYAIAEQIALYMPVMLYLAFGLDKYHNAPYYGEMDKATRAMVLKQYFLVAISGLLMALLIVFPASVSLTRVQASMLPEENESIVPFDRTFGGKVKPEILGGNGSVGMLDAWKTFGWAARIRLVKLCVKVALIQVATTVVFAMVIFGEMRLIFGETRLITGDELQKAAMRGAGEMLGHD